MRRIHPAPALILALLAGPPAHATLVFSDGQLHTINTPTGQAVVTSGGSSLAILRGASIPSAGEFEAVLAQATAGAVTISGGSITQSGPGGFALIFAAAAPLVISGGSLAGPSSLAFFGKPGADSVVSGGSFAGDWTVDVSAGGSLTVLGQLAVQPAIGLPNAWIVSGTLLSGESFGVLARAAAGSAPVAAPGVGVRFGVPAGVPAPRWLGLVMLGAAGAGLAARQILQALGGAARDPGPEDPRPDDPAHQARHQARVDDMLNRLG